MRLFVCLLFAPFVLLAQQEIDVPDEMYFLDTKITIKRSVKDDIRKSILLLRKNKAYYQTKLDRVDAYFPIIERVLRDEGVPDDFKFLPIQESSLTSDAVSSSNAVGYWQFKRESAMEHGLRVDIQIDERKNITASTKAAASYLKKSNAVFNNWIYALQSYNVGLGGTQRSVDSRYYGAREMEIDNSTHWYIVKCIAHKLAFADEEGKNQTPPLFLFEYTNGRGKSLEEIARELQVEEDKLLEYNKWLNQRRIPEDKNYLVIVPATYLEKDAVAAKVGTLPSTASPLVDGAVVKQDLKPLPEPKRLSIKAQEMYPGDKPEFALRNGLEAIKAKPGDDINKLAIQAGVSRAQFLRYNDLKVFEELIGNEYYYIESKRKKSKEPFYVVRQGQTLRDVSQLFGITIPALMRKNRMKKGEPLQAGRELWLKSKRPEDIPVKIVKLAPLPAPVVTKQLTAPKEVPVKVEQPKDTVPLTPKPVLVIPEKQSALPAKSDSVALSTPQTNVSVPFTQPAKSSIRTTLPRVFYKDTLHVVQQKETIYSIARLYSTRPDSIRKWNTIDSSGLKIGQQLAVRKQVVETRTGFVVHTVAPGETMYRIADLYKVGVSSIQEWNNKQTFSLSVGEVVFIKKQ